MLNHLTIPVFDEAGEEFGEEDSGVELGFGRDSPRPLSPPATEGPCSGRAQPFDNPCF